MYLSLVSPRLFMLSSFVLPPPGSIDQTDTTVPYQDIAVASSLVLLLAMTLQAQKMRNVKLPKDKSNHSTYPVSLVPGSSLG